MVYLLFRDPLLSVTIKTCSAYLTPSKTKTPESFFIILFMAVLLF